MQQTMSRRKEIASVRSPKSLERERRLLTETPNLPGVEYQEVKLQPPREDGIWRNAEEIVGRVASLGGYQVQGQQRIGAAHGRGVVVDFICRLPGSDECIAVECKWMKLNGSWDEKVPALAQKLEGIIPCQKAVRAYIVLFGPGWDPMKRARWTSECLDTANVKVVDIDFFSWKAWYRAL